MSTVQTTASDRVRAAAVVTKGHSVLRYRDLTSLTPAHADMEMNGAIRQLESIKAKAAAKASKQVLNAIVAPSWVRMGECFWRLQLSELVK